MLQTILGKLHRYSVSRAMWCQVSQCQAILDERDAVTFESASGRPYALCGSCWDKVEPKITTERLQDFVDGRKFFG